MQKLVKEYQEFINNNYYTCDKAMLKNLGELYVKDERFTANIDKNGVGTAQFMHDAILE